MSRFACAWDLDGLSAAQLAFLADPARRDRQAIIFVTAADEAYTAAHPLPAGERIARALPRLREALPIPPLLLPVAREGLSLAAFAARLALYAPPFDEVFVEEAAWAPAFAAVLGRPAHHLDLRGAPLDPPLLPVRRGLFVTRAQPFHLGHLAFVRQALAAEEEVNVLVAMGQRSHRPDDPATAGERVEVVSACLEAEAPGRVHVAAAPFLDEDGRNFAALRLLLPPFSRVYANSPTTAAMARSAGLEVVPFAGRVDVSATEVRRRMRAGEDWQSLVPAAALAPLARTGFVERLRALAAGEAR